MRIIEAKPEGDYRLRLQFDTGESHTVDLSHLAGKGVFVAWLKAGVFEQVAVTSSGALEWPGEIDLCPDALYLQATGKSPDEVFPEVQQRPTYA